MQQDRDPHRTATLFVRADPDPASEQSISTALSTLRELDAEGVVESYDVVPWGRTFSPDGPLTETAYHHRIARALAEFERWAAACEACLDWSFQARQVSSTLVDADQAAVSLPVVALGLYEDDELVRVAPTAETSVSAALAELAEADSPRLALAD
jgi:hypothetical protein